MAPFPWRKVYRRDFLERHRIRFPVGDFFFEDNPFHWETTTRAERFNFFAPTTHVHRMARAGQTVTSMGTKPLQIFQHARFIRAGLETTGTLAQHQGDYLLWLLKHILWCCNFVPANVINDVYDQAREHLGSVPEEAFWHALRSHDRSLPDVHKLVAVYFDQRFEFLRANAS